MLANRAADDRAGSVGIGMILATLGVLIVGAALVPRQERDDGPNELHAAAALFEYVDKTRHFDGRTLVVADVGSCLMKEDLSCIPDTDSLSDQKARRKMSAALFEQLGKNSRFQVRRIVTFGDDSALALIRKSAESHSLQ
jgi:hypothetical protein